MKNTLLFIACLVAFSSALDCNVTLPRLLLGDRYSDPNSNELALLIFDTADYCDEASLVSLGRNTFHFKLKEVITQYVNETLSHNGKSSIEFTHYLKYSVIFAIYARPDVTYSIGFLGNKHLPESRYPINHTFKLPRLQENLASRFHGPLKVVFFGDQDLTTRGAHTLAYMNSHTDVNKFDAFVFLGDYAYEFYQNNGTKGDQFLEQFAPLSFSYPLAMTPGNHEDNLNFTLFNEKFRLPSFNEDNLNNLNAFNIGLVHFLHVNLDFFSITNPIEQANFLLKLEVELKNVDRKVTPWLIAVGHKLMYCYDPSTANNSECVGFYSVFSLIDDLFQKYHVDFFITGHEHFNQVMAPMSNKTIHNYTLTNQTLRGGEVRQHLTYNDGGYISIIQGNGGCWDSKGPNRMLKKSNDAVFNETLSEANLFLTLVQVGFGWIEVVDSHNLDYFSYDAENDYIITQFRFTTNHGATEESSNDSSPTNNFVPNPNLIIKNPFLDCLYVGRNSTECLKTKVGLQTE